MLWIEIAFLYHGMWQGGEHPPPPTGPQHPDAACLPQQVNLCLASSGGQDEKQTKKKNRCDTHKQLFEEAQFLKENEASICLTLPE